MDSLPEGFLENLKRQFQSIKEHSLDSGKEAGEKIIQDSVSKIDEVLSTLKKDSPGYLRVLSMKASLLYEKAKIFLNNNRFDKSKESLENSLNLILEHSANPQIAFLYLRIVNYLSYVLSRLGELERAKTLLENVINDGLKCEPNVYSTEDLFSNTNIDENVVKSKIDKIMINNMQMLGWIYGKLGLNDLYAAMQYKSLQKELDLNDGDPVQWAIRCYRLASLFLAEGKWANARYHLAAAQVILDPLEAGLTPNPLVYRAQAELARIWVNYGLYLFSVSRKSVLDNKWEEEGESKIETKSDTKSEIESKSDSKIESKIETKAPEKLPENVSELSDFKFSGLDVLVPTVPVSEIHDNEEAKSLFVHTHKWLKRARLYYTLRDYPIQYVNIVLELSELYRLLAFYESEIDSQYNLQKKRYETLEALSGILKDVRPNCYVSVSVELIREIIEVQIELMNLNLKKLYNPSEEVNMNEEDLKRRMDAVLDINSKMDNIDYQDVQHGSETVDLDIATSGVVKSNVDNKVPENEKENKGEGEGIAGEVAR